jgi:hypothetical protein
MNIVMKGFTLISPLGNGGGVPFGIAGASVIHGKAIRKRTYASSVSVPCIFVVDDEHAIASTLTATLKMNGF